MSKSRPNYDEQRDRENYTFHPGRTVHFEWEADPGECFLFALDHRQASLLRNMLAVYPKYHWVWGLPSPRAEWDAAIQQQWDDISDFVNELEYCLLSGCDVNDITGQLDRIATALESLDEKAAAFYNWTDFVEDLENALGAGHILVNLVEGFFGLMPNLALKIDATRLVMGAWEYYTWRAPILAAITAFLGEMAVVSASLATSAGLAATHTTIGGIAGILDAAAFLRDIAFGNKNIWDDFIKPLWNNWTSTDDGGTGGIDPDNDPILNNLVNVFVRQEAMANYITVNCGGCGGLGCSACGGSGFIADESGSGSSIDGPEYDQPSAGSSPPPGWSSWSGDDGYLAYKCKAANALALGLAESLGALGDVGNNTYTDQVHSTIIAIIKANFSILSSAIGSLPFAGAAVNTLTENAQQWTAQKMALAVDTAFSTISQTDVNIFYDLRLKILESREPITCGLYNAVGVATARTIILDEVDTIMATLSYNATVKQWARDIVQGNINNNWLKALWRKDSLINKYLDATAIDCVVCGIEYTVQFGVVDADDSTTIEFTAGVWPFNFGCTGYGITFTFNAPVTGTIQEVLSLTFPVGGPGHCAGDYPNVCRWKDDQENITNITDPAVVQDPAALVINNAVYFELISATQFTGEFVR